MTFEGGTNPIAQRRQDQAKTQHEKEDSTPRNRIEKRKIIDDDEEVEENKTRTRNPYLLAFSAVRSTKRGDVFEWMKENGGKSGVGNQNVVSKLLASKDMFLHVSFVSAIFIPILIQKLE